jgi:hypothetical protein
VNPGKTPSRAAIAALNNAAWCDAVCRAHGGATTFDEATWMNAAPGPRFYPNLITLRAGAAAVVEAAMGWLDARLGRQWSVKDSFAELDLQGRGFTPLFDAAWLWRGTLPAVAPTRHADGMSWTAVAGTAELAEWERAWEPLMDDVATARAELPQFPAALLARREIVFVAARRAGRIVAGGVLNAAVGVVGLSNVFAEPAGLSACWARLVDAAQTHFPGLPQCTYEQAQPSEQPLAQGFEFAGPLRVWLR